MKLIELDVIGALPNLAQMDRLLHALDVFEPSKHYVIHSRIRIEVSDKNPILNSKDFFVEESIKRGGYVLFCAIRKIDGLRINDDKIHFAKDVNTVTVRQDEKFGWLLFKEMLEQLDYTVTTDERMFITSVI
jgi:hypothetical protein